MVFTYWDVLLECVFGFILGDGFDFLSLIKDWRSNGFLKLFRVGIFWRALWASVNVPRVLYFESTSKHLYTKGKNKYIPKPCYFFFSLQHHRLC